MTTRLPSIAATAFALACCSPLAAQYLTPFTVNNLTSQGGTSFGFGDAGLRVLLRATNGAYGYFDLATGGNPTFVQIIDPFAAGSVDSIIWERSTATPTTTYDVQNDVNGNAVLVERYLVGGATQLPTLSFATNESWRVEGVRTGNNTFFLRRANTQPGNSVGNLFYTGRSGIAGNPPRLTPTSGPAATEPLTVIDNGSLSQIAFLSNGTTGQQVSFVNFNGSVPGGVVSFNVPANHTMTDLKWIDTQYLVARMSNNATPSIHKIVRFNRNNPLAIRDLTIGVDVETLEVSGDRQWLSFITRQIVAGTPERSASVMHVRDGLTTEPGGAYTVLTPLELFVYSIPPFVQQDPNAQPNELDPTIFFFGQGPNDPLSFYRTGMEREVSIHDRVVAAAPGQSFSFEVDAHFNVLDQIWALGASFSRTNTPGAYLDNPVLTDPVIVAGIGFPFNASQTITLQVPTSPAFVAQNLYLQAGWIDSNDNFFVGRVTELPIFN